MSSITQIIVPSNLISSIKPTVDVTESAGFTLELNSPTRSFSFDVTLMHLNGLDVVLPKTGEISEEDLSRLSDASKWNSVYLATFTGLYRSNVDLISFLDSLAISYYTDAYCADSTSYVELELVSDKIVYSLHTNQSVNNKHKGSTND